MVCHRFFLGVTLLLTASWVGAQDPGDVDGNGIVTSTDAALLADHLLGAGQLTASQAQRADCNGQAGLDAADAVWIINIANGTPVPSSDMILVPAGTFAMGDPWGEGWWDERPVHSVTLSAYLIGRDEVTNAEYAAFLNRADVTVTNGEVFLESDSSYMLFGTYPIGSADSQIEYSGGIFKVRVRDGLPMDDHPVIEVTWCGAAAHCNWLSRRQGLQEVYTESGDWPSDLSRNGYHLPTEAQWERAAAWEPGHGHWRYGFSSDLTSRAQANYTFANPLGLTSCTFTSPKGWYSNSESPVGCHDMSGNAWEWCNDWLDAHYYETSSPIDPEGSPSGTIRILRGGDWMHDESHCRTSDRDGHHMQVRNNINGFRLARRP